MNTQIPVISQDGLTSSHTVELPQVFTTPILPHIVISVFKRLNMDTRQPYAVSPNAGKQHSAEGWGTGRAVARVPRVKGSGTRRAGQGAFANFCRKGRLAHPTKVTRKWKRKVNENEKMIACRIGIASTAMPSLVEARGHNISSMTHIPCVVSNNITEFKKTKEAYEFLKKIGTYEELTKKDKKNRPGIGKMRNRRYRKRRGMLLVHTGPELKAFRNIPNIELMSIENMCLKKLAPGGQLGRLVIWTEDAFKALDSLFEKTKMLGSILSQGPEVFYSNEVQALIEDVEYEGVNEVDRKPEECMKRHPYLDLFNGNNAVMTN